MANDDTVASPEQPDEDFDDTTEDTPAEEQDGPSWAEEDFSPLFIDEHGGYVRDGGRTLRRTSTGLVVVCGFVPELLGEIVIERKLDQPGTDIGHSLVVRYETPEGHRTTARVAIDELSPAAAIIKHAPGAAARASVARPGEIALAATAFKAAAFFSQTHYGQVGWTRDGNYAFPGSEDVSLDHLGQGKGLQLLRIPSAPDPATFRLAAETLLTIVKSAPARTTLLMLGTLAAGPVFRSEYHLGARAFITMMTGRSGVGKTTLLRRVSGLIGDFHRQPGAILFARDTAASIEQYLHALGDLAVPFDNYRASDGNAREVFRDMVLALGDGSARVRSGYAAAGLRVLPSLAPRSLVIATGEHGFEDDAAVNARLIEVTVDTIDVRALLSLNENALSTLPHLFSAYVHFLRSRPSSFWVTAREDMNELATRFAPRAAERTGEHLATIVVSLKIFSNFLVLVSSEIEAGWRDLIAEFTKELDDIADIQASRVRGDHLDEVVLREIARAFRSGHAHLEPIGVRERPPVRGELLGGYDAEHLFLSPDVTTNYVSRQLRASGRRTKSIGRKELAMALAIESDGELPQRTLAGKRHRGWLIRRSRLGLEWEGLLDLVPVRGSREP